MSRYTDSTLQKGEEVVQVGRLHWVIYMRAILYASLALVVMAVSYFALDLGRLSIAFGSPFAAMAVRHAIHAWWLQFTTEIAVTNKRVIYKTGFIRRSTDEMFLPQIESVYVEQSILGRLLNFGSIHTRGAGEGIEHLHDIAKPLAVQNAINVR
jgi:uncharacterized membrane protein YdbT with pleckstrin-like domain